jgi:hypothetical protein
MNNHICLSLNILQLEATINRQQTFDIFLYITIITIAAT